MKFCSKCGSSNIEFKVPPDDNLRRYCGNDCNSIFYSNPNSVVGSLCTFEDKLLLCKRNIQPRLGMWTLPAGFFENSETQRMVLLEKLLRKPEQILRIFNLIRYLA